MLQVLSLFSGIGAFEKALERLKISHEIVAYCEIDKYASKAYSLIHNVPEEKNLIDVTKVDFLSVSDRVDLVTYGFPCQDISNAGKQRGFEYNGEKTRSGLFFDALRIIDDYRPKFAIAENVKALTSKKFKTEFKIVLSSLEEIGYKNFWMVLNSKNYGVPQNRERVFIISIRNDIAPEHFEFPEPFELQKRLKDILETEVDEKFYLTDNQIKHLTGNSFRSAKSRLQEKDYKDPKCIKVLASIYNDEKNLQAGRVYDPDGISPCLDTMVSGGQKQPKIAIREATLKGYAEDTIGDSINLEQPNSKTRRGRVGNYGLEPDFAIRKLTPLECWRLMGFDDEDVEVCVKNGISNTQLYKQAGNSIVVNVLEAMFSKLGKIYEDFRSE